MAWVSIGIAVVGGVASYAQGQAAKGDAEAANKAELEAQKELQANKRKYQLEDRKYAQDAVGNWSKYLDPALAPNAGQGSQGAPTDTQGPLKGGKWAVDDPNNPAYAAAPTQAPSNFLPINHAGQLAGMRPVNGMAPSSFWYPRQYPQNGQ